MDHWYWKMKLAEELGLAGHEVELEKDGADLAAQKDGKRIAVEIETGKSDVEANIRRDLGAGVDQVMAVYIGSAPGPANPDPKVQILSLGAFLRELHGDSKGPLGGP